MYPFALKGINHVEKSVETAGCMLLTSFLPGWKESNLSDTIQPSFTMIELREVVNCSQTSQHLNSES